MHDLSPEELLLWCRRTLPGDTSAFEALVARYKGLVFAIARRMMGSAEEAEDQAQESFLKIYRGLLSLENPAALTDWVRRVTVNTCLDALAMQRRRPAAAAAGEGFDPDVEDRRAAGPAAAAEREELRRCLERALAGLGPDARKVIVLRDVEGWSYEEIAPAVGVEPGALKMRLHRARLAVRRLLKSLCPGLAGAARA